MDAKRDPGSDSRIKPAPPDVETIPEEPSAPDSVPPTEPPPQAFASTLGGLEEQIVAGRYRVIRKLGEGGMGTVYLAEHETIEKKVALKVLLHEYARKPDLKDRFLQEAKAAAKIGHENIVDITDFGPTPDGSVFFAMEFLEGQDLSQVIKKEGALPWSRAKPILVQICRALGAAHSKGIVHRDMKPENIYLIEREGRSDFVKLLDFGIAKMNVEKGEKRLTRTGMIFGTPEYMSPEQAQGNTPDHRVDIYAVGVIMYELLTASVPFKADTFMGILTKHIFENPVPPSQLNPEAGIPVEVEEIILKAMAKDRAERFQSMTEMAAAIAQASGRMTRPTGDNPQLPPRRIASPSQTYAPAASLPRPSTVTELPDRPPRSSGPLLIGVIVALLVVGGVATAVVMRGNEPERPPVPTRPVRAPTTRPAAVKPEAVTVEITVKSRPPGAAIFRGAPAAGKEPIGVTPKTVKLPRDDRSLLLTLRLEGYRDESIAIVPSKDKELIAPLTRKPSPVVRRPPHPKRPPTPKRPPEPKKAPGAKKPERVDDLMNPFKDQ